METCSAINEVEFNEKLGSSERSRQFTVDIRKASDAPKRSAEKPATRPFQRNQSLYYFPGTVCSKFGARLRELRHERNLTQDRMALDFGIDRSFISDVERGRKSISLPLLEVIALGMNMSLSDLLKDL